MNPGPPTAAAGASRTASGAPAVRTGPRPRRIGRVHWRGLWTLWRREVHRFFRWGVGMLAGPILSVLLYFGVMVLALGDATVAANREEILAYVLSGLIAFTTINTAFLIPAVSLIYDKYDGNLVDILMSPLSPLELGLGYVLAGSFCGLVTGAGTLAATALVFPLAVPDPGLALIMAVLASLFGGSMGLLLGIWANRWDSLEVLETFVILPLCFLSGVFASVALLPFAVSDAVRLLPFFYLIDGVRAGLTGEAAVAAWQNLAVGVAAVVVLLALAWCWLARGYRIKT